MGHSLSMKTPTSKDYEELSGKFQKKVGVG
jgi:hypothetical protein